MYLDIAFFSSPTSFGFESGKPAEVCVVTHEYGRHIEEELGVFDIAARLLQRGHRGVMRRGRSACGLAARAP